VQQLSPQDAMFAYMERPNAPLQLGWLNIYDPASSPGGQVGFDEVVAYVEARLHTIRFFREKLAFLPLKLGEPFWVDDENFDLERHISQVELAAPGDWPALTRLVARLFEQPLDFARPLWEFHVIRGLDNVAGYPKGSFAVLAKIHHAAVDGISGVDVTTLLHAETPAAASPTGAAAPWTPAAEPGPLALLGRSYLSTLRHPARRLRSVARNLPVFKRVKDATAAGELQAAPRRKVPPTKFSGPVGPHRAIDAVRFPLEELRPIRALVPEATLNDVLLGICGGALRRLLLSQNALPAEPLLATCPISIRSADERGKFGNRIGNMVIGLATELDDPVDRLGSIQAETASAKEMTEAIGAQTLSEMSEILPGALVSLATRVSTRLAGSAVANTTVTNVPGPQQRFYLAGAELLSQFALGTLLDGMGLFHFIHSYCGEITLTVTADRDKLPDPAFYADCIRDEFATLRNLGFP
jgi:diacylglycerol O-acyltransferase / wax synthase